MTETSAYHIDPYLFEQYLELFRKLVQEEVNIPFLSFASHPYTVKHEGYKYDIYRTAREALAFQSWKKSDIGNGKIVEATIKSIEVTGSNLVPYQARYGEDSRPHHTLYEAKDNPEKLTIVESYLYGLYHNDKDSDSFSNLVSIFGKTYPLLAYLFFLKDRSKFLPIAPKSFDKAFHLFGTEFKTTRRASWENYTTYNGLIGELKFMLTESLETEVSLLDAHSFAWILAHLEAEKIPEEVERYLNLDRTERDAIVKARLGQGRFRRVLIDYWSACAITGCTKLALLKASHIKPWSDSNLAERLDLYNGLLLSPTLDACFDSGYVSFDDTGKIIISNGLSSSDMIALGIKKDMRLAKLENGHKEYLAYHRNNIFKTNS